MLPSTDIRNYLAIIRSYKIQIVISSYLSMPLDNIERENPTGFLARAGISHLDCELMKREFWKIGGADCHKSSMRILTSGQSRRLMWFS